MLLEFVLTLIIVLLSVIWILWKYHFQKIKKLPPGPKKIPIFGSLPFFPKEVKESKKRMQVWMKEEYGPISCLQSMWQENIVFISDINLIKDVLKKSEASARPKVWLYMIGCKERERLIRNPCLFEKTRNF